VGVGYGGCNALETEVTGKPGGSDGGTKETMMISKIGFVVVAPTYYYLATHTAPAQPREHNNDNTINSK